MDASVCSHIWKYSSSFIYLTILLPVTKPLLLFNWLESKGNPCTARLWSGGSHGLASLSQFVEIISGAPWICSQLRPQLGKTRKQLHDSWEIGVTVRIHHSSETTVVHAAFSVPIARLSTRSGPTLFTQPKTRPRTAAKGKTLVSEILTMSTLIMLQKSCKYPHYAAKNRSKTLLLPLSSETLLQPLLKKAFTTYHACTTALCVSEKSVARSSASSGIFYTGHKNHCSQQGADSWIYEPFFNFMATSK